MKSPGVGITAFYVCPTVGFAKSRPKANGTPRSRAPEAQRPGCLAARRPGGLVLIFHSFLSSVNPRPCTDLNRVLACKMEDGELEFDYHFNIRFNPFRPFSFVACC